MLILNIVLGIDDLDPKLYILVNLFPTLKFTPIFMKFGTHNKSNIIINGWKPLTIITKRSILDVAATLDPPLNMLIMNITLASIYSAHVIIDSE